MNNDKKNFTPESIALGCQLTIQTKGDFGAARRQCEGAAHWLASVDPDYREPALTLALPADIQQTERADAAERALASAQGDVQAYRKGQTVALAERDRQIALVQNGIERIQALAAEIGEARTAFLRVSSENAELRRALHEQVAAPVIPPPPAKVAPPVPVAPVAAPAPVAVKVAPVAQAGGAVDPFAHLPAHMKAWARAKSAPSIEID